MTVRLDRVPAVCSRPVRPRGWLWLGGLPLLFLLLGVCGTYWFGSPLLRQQPVGFWGLAIGAPFLGWVALCFGRVLLYFGQQQVADGWDLAREEDLIVKVRQGRRVQQVLSVSLHTALRGPDESPATQLESLHSDVNVIKALRSRQDQGVLRHSRLAGGPHETAEQVLRRVFLQLLADLLPTLKQAPESPPLALLLNVDSSVPQEVWQRLWQEAWRESGICQRTVAIEGCGLAALDQWLDQRSGDQALMLVVALHFAPQLPEGTAEVAVGLLFGNRLTQAVLSPIAHVHRPEREREPTTDGLLYATRQALDWVPLDAHAVEHVWQSGVHVDRREALPKVLDRMSLASEHKRYDLDVRLGNPGNTSPWLAIAAAAQTIHGGTGPQLIFSGGGCADAALWSTVLTPAPSLPNKEV